jgi:hypothetical protein
MSHLNAALSKFLRDKAVGVIFIPASVPAHHRAFAHLASFSFAAVFPQAWTAYVVLGYGRRAAQSPPRTLSLHPLWDSLVNLTRSSLHVSAWRTLLAKHPDDRLVIDLLRAIPHGVSFGYQGDRLAFVPCPTPQGWYDHETELLRIRAAEVAKGWRSRPFPLSSPPPLFNMKCGPVKGITKSFSPKIRHVNDMSFPRGTSVNDNIPDGTTRHTAFATAADLLAALGPGAILQKCDAVAAYKVPHVALEDLHLQGEQTPEGYSFSGRPNFGCKSSGDRWDEFGAAIEFIFRQALLGRAYVLRYSDDFLFVTPPGPNAAADALSVAATVNQLCSELGIVMGKWAAPSSRITWLGLILDSAAMTIELTPARHTFLSIEVARWATRSDPAPRKHLESIHGHLQFAAKVVEPGRFFLRRLSTAIFSHASVVQMSEDLKKDFTWWADFLPTWSGTSLVKHTEWLSASSLNLATDSCKSGGGGVYGKRWFYIPWTPEILAIARRTKSIDMVFLELYSIAIACATWGHLWSRLRITLHTDSQDCVHAFTSARIANPHSQELFRCITLLQARFDFVLRLEHLAGKLNVQADLISRNHIPRFLSQFPSAFRFPDTALLPPAHRY